MYHITYRLPVMSSYLPFFGAILTKEFKTIREVDAFLKELASVRGIHEGTTKLE